MPEFFETSVFFGVFISLISYGIGTLLNKKLKLAVFNPLLIAVIIIIAVLVLLDIDYETYNEGAKYISYLLTPATVCLAVPLYEILKEHHKAVIAGIVAGVVTSLCSILLFAVIFSLDRGTYVTLLPKSITTAIGMGVSEKLGGYVALTVAVIIITGILGNMFAESICRIFRITDPVARGVGIGTSAHAVGTARAMQMGEVEGAMSSLSIVVAGLFTVIGASIFANLF